MQLIAQPKKATKNHISYCLLAMCMLSGVGKEAVVREARCMATYQAIKPTIWEVY
jgi:hypothetical protein